MHFDFLYFSVIFRFQLMIVGPTLSTNRPKGDNDNRTTLRCLMRGYIYEQSHQKLHERFFRRENVFNFVHVCVGAYDLERVQVQTME